MIAGTIGPIASAFSICALVSPWRQHFIQGGDPDSAPYIPDPAWYVPSTIPSRNKGVSDLSYIG